jgi:hypothetical protein
MRMRPSAPNWRVTDESIRKTERRIAGTRYPLVQSHGYAETVNALLDRAMWCEFEAGFDDRNKHEARVITPLNEAQVLRQVIEGMTAKANRLSEMKY